MAEARLAVNPRPTVTRAGFEVNTTVKKVQMNISRAGLVLYIPHPKFLVRSFIKSIWRTGRKVKTALLPIPVWMFCGVVCGVTVWVVRSPSDTWQRNGRLAHWLWAIDKKNPLPNLMGFSTSARVAYLTFWFSGMCMTGITMLQRQVLKHILTYHGWLDRKQQKSLKTKIWGFVLKYVYIRRIANNLIAYQGALPTLPVPSVETTVKKYLRSMEPLLNEEEMAEAKQLADGFLKNESGRLQYYLKLKWLISSNYVSDWWLNFVYLRARDPLPINSNWYGVLSAEYRPTKLQAARAASITYEMVKMKRDIDNEIFEPQLILGIVPLCMKQYESAFSTTRVPRPEQDELIQAEPHESRHVIVLYKGRFYVLPCFSPKSNKPLSCLQLFFAFQGILDSDDETDPDEIAIPAFTTMRRNEWYEIREKHFMQDAYNRTRLELIEKAMFVITLDDAEEPKSLSEEGRRLLMGNGHNLWCDKSFNLIIDSSAQVGVHAEHAWADAPTLAHLMEICSVHEEHMKNYTPDGNIKPTKEDAAKQKSGLFRVYPAERIVFQIDEELSKKAIAAQKDYLTRVNDVDYHVLHFRHFGKGRVKDAKVSPDAFLQLSFQLAYYRDQGHFDQTYESSMTRLFFAGRTETIRSASTESAKFVVEFEKKKDRKSDEELIKLLRASCEHHQQLSYDAMTGAGVDRHLFALYVVSVGKAIESPFLKFALGRQWKLSTSQVPTNQCPDSMHAPDRDRFWTPNGGFGPVADDGYGLHYCVFGENMFFFNVSGKKSKSNTDSKRYAKAIEKAMIDLMTLFPEKPKEAKKKN